MYYKTSAGRQVSPLPVHARDKQKHKEKDLFTRTPNTVLSVNKN